MATFWSQNDFVQQKNLIEFEEDWSSFAREALENKIKYFVLHRNLEWARRTLAISKIDVFFYGSLCCRGLSWFLVTWFRSLMEAKTFNLNRSTDDPISNCKNSGLRMVKSMFSKLPLPLHLFIYLCFVVRIKFYIHIYILTRNFNFSISYLFQNHQTS